MGNITQDYINELENRYTLAQYEENRYKEAHKQTQEEILNDRIKIDDLISEHDELKNQKFKTSVDSTREELQKQVDDYQQHYDNLKTAFEEGAPGVTEDMINSTSDMVDRAKHELDKIPEKITETGNSSKDAVLKGTVDINNAWNTSIAEQLSSLTDKKVEFEDLGNGQVQMYVDGLATGQPKAKSEMSQIVSGVINKIEEKKADAKQAGEYLLDGLKEGIQSKEKKKNILDYIWDFGSGIVKTFKDIFGIHSPSKVTKEIGKYLVMGLSDGMAENAGDAVRQAETVSKRVVNGFEKATVSKRILITKASSRLAEAVSSELRDGLRNSSVIETQSRIITENRFAQPDRQASQLGEVLSKLDTLTKTVEKTAQKDIRLNDGTLVGSTAKKYDSALGEIAAKRERGW